MESQHAQRKNEHISLAEKLYGISHQNHPFDGVRIIHQSLPELSIQDVTLTSALTETIQLSVPFYIEAMTGGSELSLKLNQQLARIAADCDLAMACGSQSVALKHPDGIDSFQVLRQENPNGVLIANISAAASPEQVKTVVQMIDANAVELHLNVAQELVMPEGERSFRWLDNINEIVQRTDVPVIVKEVGFGMSQETIQQLINTGVKNINVSGRGGTNFARIENRRNHENDFDDLADWGQTTPESLLESQRFQKEAHVIASGGIVTPLDVIKCGNLGAQAVGVAGYFLNKLIREGDDALIQTINNWRVEIERVLLLCGCRQFNELTKVPHVLSNELQSYFEQRNTRNDF